ncbi:MAG: Unknown protein [uncultured Thiotrichaceae bacterium]|uniref:Phage shock protein A n=1 Tax=uncultured Thiotrichaceae bacterium TaxID=298394 RepID=A0A6S6TFA7_9GAMM|nr:MAG: Unknown protein [uncultured Thiotrichaceae bacterium]
MRIMQKLTTALRGSVRETAEIVIDANSLRIFAQEIHECEQHIRKTKEHLAQLIAEKMRVKRELGALETTLQRQESEITKKLEQDNENAAMQLAQSVADKEPILEQHRLHYQQLTEHEQRLQNTLQGMVNKLGTYQAEYRLAQTTAKMQQSQSRLAFGSAGGTAHFSDMQDSLTRVKERQQRFADEVTAMEQVDAKLSGLDIDTQTQQQSAKDVLDRIKAGKDNS